MGPLHAKIGFENAQSAKDIIPSIPYTVFSYLEAAEGVRVLGAACVWSQESGVFRESKRSARLRTMSPVDLYMVRDCAPSGSTGAKV